MAFAGAHEQPLATVLFTSPLSEKALYQLRAAACQHTSLDLHAVVQLRVVQDLHDRVDRTSLGIIGAVDQAFYTRVDQCAGAHGTRLNCSKQLAVSEAMVTNESTRCAQGDDLGMGGGIVAGEIAIPPPGNNAAVADNDCAHGNFSGLQRPLTGSDRFFHEQFVIGERRGVSRQSLVVGQSCSRNRELRYPLTIVAGRKTNARPRKRPMGQGLKAGEAQHGHCLGRAAAVAVRAS